MTKWEALYVFFKGFGVRAFEENSVPTGRDKPEYPYIVYEIQQGGYEDDTDVFLSFSLIDKNDSFTGLYELSNTIAEAIGESKTYKLDKGFMRIQRATPWAQNQRDANDNTVRRLYHIIEVTYYTSY